MKRVRSASVLFAVGSSVYWMLASMIQYHGLRPILDAPQEPEAWAVALIGVLPLVIYALICLYTFRWLARKMTDLSTFQPKSQDD